LIKSHKGEPGTPEGRTGLIPQAKKKRADISARWKKTRGQSAARQHEP
jgi:hypothetical protein